MFARLTKDLLESLPQAGGALGVCPAGGDGNLHVFAVDSGWDLEIAFLSRIGDIGPNSPAAAGLADGSIERSEVGCGKDQIGTIEVRRFKFPMLPGNRELGHFGISGRGDDNDMSTCFNQSFSLTHRHRTGTDDQNAVPFQA